MAIGIRSYFNNKNKALLRKILLFQRKKRNTVAFQHPDNIGASLANLGVKPEEWAIAAIPHNEPDRLARLCDYALLDTESEEEFDEVTRLARDLFDVPVSLISLVDRDRQWFKSRCGTDLTETSRDVSFCAHAILANQTMIINDTLDDLRFRANPLVIGAPYIRFYAGSPVTVEGGKRLGTICLIDTKPRHNFTPQQRRHLERLSYLVGRIMDYRAIYVRENNRNNAKSEFLAYISHEIRTPMNAMVGIAKLLNDSPELSPKLQPLVRTLNDASQSLLDLVNSTVDMASIGTRDYFLQSEFFELDALLDDIYRLLQIKASLKNIDMNFDCPALRNVNFKGDKTRLRQILMNIVGNAVKFTNAGSVTLKAGILPVINGDPARNMLQIEVADTGIGIPEEKIDRIFDRYVQAPATTDMDVEKGTGLGLAITRQLVEKMGGTIHAASKLGEGSQFFISLPAEILLRNAPPA